MALPNSAGAGVTITTGATVIYKPGVNPAGRAIRVANRAASGNNLLVNVSGIHAAGEFEGIEPSTVPREYRASNLSLGTVTVKSDSGTCVIDFGICEV